MTDWPPISAGRLKQARRLVAAKGRQRAGAMLAEGPQAVREALAWARTRLVIVLADAPPTPTALAHEAFYAGVPVATASPTQMATITDTVHSQGIIAVCEIPSVTLDDIASTGLDDIHARSLDDIPAPKLALILDQVRDPGNVGTLIRTADAFGADAVIATEGSAEVWAPKVVRSSVGSVFHIPIVTNVSFEDATSWGKKAGLQVLAAEAGGVPLDQQTEALRNATAWIVGNEASGLPPEHLALADQSVAVPMWGKAESLNVATAAAICLYTTAQAQRTSR